MWLDGFEQKAASTPGGTFDGSPWKLVLHTTEGGSIEGAIGSFVKTGSWPHFTVDARAGRKIQHYPLSTSARALAHPKGSPETNRAGAIQIEIVGFAADTPAWAPEELDWLGRDVVAPIRAARPFPLTFPTFVGPEAGTIASARAPQRLTWDAWAAFSGLLGHQHVPGNDHWDPGRLDVARIVVAAMDPNQLATPEEDDMGQITDPEQIAALERIDNGIAALIDGQHKLDARVAALEGSVGTELDKHVGEVRRNVRRVGTAVKASGIEGTA